MTVVASTQFQYINTIRVNSADVEGCSEHPKSQYINTIRVNSAGVEAIIADATDRTRTAATAAEVGTMINNYEIYVKKDINFNALHISLRNLNILIVIP